MGMGIFIFVELSIVRFVPASNHLNGESIFSPLHPSLSPGAPYLIASGHFLFSVGPEAFKFGSMEKIIHDQQQGLTFGIYPGGESGSDKGVITGPADNPEHIERSLAILQGSSAPFLIRAYYQFSDPGSAPKGLKRNPEDVEKYLHGGRLLDLVLKFQSTSGNVDGYLDFVRAHVREYGSRLHSIQVTEEASFTHGPDCIDGPYPRVREALVQGVIAAKDEARKIGHAKLRVGFNSTPTFGPAEEFWAAIGEMGGDEFVQSLGYVGLDFFPDVFRPVASDGEPGDLRSTVIGVLETMRNVWLPAAEIPASVPIDIAEHGWPTGPARPDIRQVRSRLNLDRYTLFCLRDTDSSPSLEEDVFYHFGIMRDDYSPKPAFDVFRKLVEEFGVLES